VGVLRAYLHHVAFLQKPIPPDDPVERVQEFHELRVQSRDD
jgi:hypothetical protein